MKIYYSRSNEVEDEKVLPLIAQFISNLPNYGGTPHELTYHKRGSIYNSELVNEADIIIVGISEEYVGNVNRVEVGKGCFTECGNAFGMGKPVLVIKNDTDNNKPFIQNVKPRDFKVKNEHTWQIGYGTINIYTKYYDRGISIHENSCYDSYIDSSLEVHTFMMNVMPKLKTAYGIGETKDKDLYTSLLNKGYSTSNQVTNSSSDEYDEQYLLL